MDIFTFGSNEAGIHGAGSALHARKYHGAIYGQGVGLQGNSYAIPTKDFNINSLSLKQIKYYVDNFISFAINNPELTFNVVDIGCGLAGFTKEQIAPMFKDAPKNCKFSKEFQEIIDKLNE
jgi:hypothetical protein